MCRWVGATLHVVTEVVPQALARLEAQLGAALCEHHDDIVHQLARILVGLAVEEHQGRISRNGHPVGPKLCAHGCGRLAAPARTVCESCRKREQRQRQQLQRSQAAEVEAARQGKRGARAQELVNGQRTTVPQAWRQQVDAAVGG